MNVSGEGKFVKCLSKMSKLCVSEEDEIREGKSRADICCPDMRLFDVKTSWGPPRTPRLVFFNWLVNVRVLCGNGNKLEAGDETR